jgi:hypothetical protein
MDVMNSQALQTVVESDGARSMPTYTTRPDPATVTKNALILVGGAVMYSDGTYWHDVNGNVLE